ncbi:MAG: efflux RND transporter periplasmic adaptor subunit [Spirochaetota bacterium]|nr:efflux RND transporter periplasmic adaptor subunit [Spirochaetota bacterium]
MIKEIVLNNKKKVLIAGVAVIILILIYFLRSGVDNSEYIYDYEKVSVGEISKTISTTGTIDLLDPVSILCQVNGVVQKVYVDFNQHVKHNQLLALIDAGDLQNDITKMQKKLEQLNIDLKNMENDLKVKKSMYNEHMISASALEMAENEYKKMQLSYSQVLVDYKNLLQMQKNTRIFAPISGIIVSREINESDPVVRNKRLFLMVRDLKTMQIMVVIDETDIGKVKSDQKIKFTVNAYPDQTFTGAIRQIRFNPVNRGGVITYDAVAICDNSQYLLKPGMTAIVTIEVDKKQNAMRIPNDAFTVIPPFIDQYKLDKDKKYIWKKKRGSIEPVEVQTGLYGDEYTEIKKGDVKPGDTILIRVRKQISITK